VLTKSATASGEIVQRQGTASEGKEAKSAIHGTLGPRDYAPHP